MRNHVLNLCTLQAHDIGPTYASTKTSGLMDYPGLLLSHWKKRSGELLISPRHFTFFLSAKSLGVVDVH